MRQDSIYFEIEKRKGYIQGTYKDRHNMAHKDYYKIMGVPQDAAEKDIKMAYRRLARKYHPDLNKEADAEEKFKELGEAYEVLKDAEKRKAYDQFGPDWNHSFQQPHAHDSATHTWKNFEFDSDLFESILGQRFRQKQSGADLQASINISLEEAYHGVEKNIQLQGSSLRVKIPSGIKAGQKIRLAGKGQPGTSGAPSGDLFITIQINKHPLFDIKGNDIYITLPVTPWEVALGSSVVVPTLSGKVDLKIPAGSQGGQTLRLKKRGLPGKTPGDQYILLKIVIPQPKTAEQKSIYQTMAERMPFNPRAKMGAAS